MRFGLFEERGEYGGLVGVESVEEALKDCGAASGPAEKSFDLPGDPIRFGADRRVPIGAPASETTHLSLGTETVEHLGDCGVGHIAAELFEYLSGRSGGVGGPQCPEDLPFEFTYAAAIWVGRHIDRLRHLS